MQPSDRWIEGIRAGDPRAVFALHRLLERMARADLTLTAREREVLQLMSFGHTRESAAERMEVTVETVKTHLQWAYIKLNARSVTHAVALAWRSGQID